MAQYQAPGPDTIGYPTGSRQVRINRQSSQYPSAPPLSSSPVYSTGNIIPQQSQQPQQPQQQDFQRYSPPANTIYLQDYKNSLVILGDTKPWKENIKKLGGKFNGSLLINGNKTPGWLFFDKGQRDELQAFVNTANDGSLQPSEVVSGPGPRSRVATSNKLQYQNIKYRVVLPYVGQGVTLTINSDSEKMMVVSHIPNDRPNVVDVITLKYGDAEHTAAVVSGEWEIIDFGKEHTLKFH